MFFLELVAQALVLPSIVMPSASVVQSPLWSDHLREVSEWASPSYSINERAIHIQETLKKEDSKSAVFWADSADICNPSFFAPFAIPEEVAAVHRSKNILFFEDIFRSVGDTWGNPANSPLRRGFRTVGPIEDTPLWAQCPNKKTPPGQKAPSYEEALLGLKQDASARESTPFEEESILKQGWAATKDALASGCMQLREIARPKKGLIIYSFYLPQKWSSELGKYKKIRLIANERPKNRAFSFITKKLNLPSHKYLISLITKCLFLHSDEDTTSLKQRALESLKHADKTEPERFEDLEPPLKKTRAREIALIEKEFIEIIDDHLYIILSDAHSSRLPKPYRKAFRRHKDKDPYASSSASIHKFSRIAGNVAVIPIRKSVSPPSKDDPMSSRISLFKKGLA